MIECQCQAEACSKRRWSPLGLIYPLKCAKVGLGGPADRQDAFRDVTIAYTKLADLAASSKRNVQRLIETLRRKLAIEVIQPENRDGRQAKTYR